jgi:hypothetical protein
MLGIIIIIGLCTLFHILDDGESTVSTRLEYLLALLGVNYAPPKWLCSLLTIITLSLIYILIFKSR